MISPCPMQIFATGGVNFLLRRFLFYATYDNTAATDAYQVYYVNIEESIFYDDDVTIDSYR